MTTSPAEARDLLTHQGYVHLPGAYVHLEDAWSAAQRLIEGARPAGPELTIVGDFVIPAPDGAVDRGFQALHIDFGLPLSPRRPTDIARFTALHVPEATPPTDAVTRLVPLRSLLGPSSIEREEMLARLAAYGETHGAWDDDAGYTEGILARIVEAALGDTPVLASVKTTSGFLCGTEFGSLADEVAFFAERGIRLDRLSVEVCLQPGELLVFDNLALAHGRRGHRRPGELHQRLFGYRSVLPVDQAALRDRTLDALLR